MIKQWITLICKYFFMGINYVEKNEAGDKSSFGGKRGKKHADIPTLIISLNPISKRRCRLFQFIHCVYYYDDYFILLYYVEAKRLE